MPHFATKKIREASIKRLEGGLREQIGDAYPRVVFLRGLEISHDGRKTRGHDGLPNEKSEKSSSTDYYATHCVCRGQEQCESSAEDGVLARGGEGGKEMDGPDMGEKETREGQLLEFAAAGGERDVRDGGGSGSTAALDAGVRGRRIGEVDDRGSRRLFLSVCQGRSTAGRCGGRCNRDRRAVLGKRVDGSWGRRGAGSKRTVCHLTGCSERCSDTGRGSSATWRVGEGVYIPWAVYRLEMQRGKKRERRLVWLKDYDGVI